MDSRRVKPNDLFFAIPGLTVDGRDYIPQAIQQGAAIVLKEIEGTIEETEKTKVTDEVFAAIVRDLSSATTEVPTIEVPNLRQLIGPLASRYFGEPSKTLQVIGITGTNGKTSTTHFIAQILANCQLPCGIMGSLGNGHLGKLNLIDNPREAHCTTMDAIGIQEYLANFKKEGTKTVAMEVTSHALTQGRVTGIQFDTTVFTNLSRDHIDDYHNNMNNYWAAKKSLFTNYHAKNSIINLDNEYGQTLFKELKAKFPERNVLGFMSNTSKDFYNNLSKDFSQNLNNHFDLKSCCLIVREFTLDSAGIRATIDTPWGRAALQCALLGQFNLSNILAALAVVCSHGIPLQQAITAIHSLQTVPGRMMRFGGEAGLPLVVVDYAHKPEALQQVLIAVKQHAINNGRLWCVFGCGGDRDRGKRPLMTQIACQYSDTVIATQDNLRTEDPKQIFADMMKDITSQDAKKVVIEMDRSKAIFQAILQAKPEDIIVVAGKGHENYQIVGAKEIYFSDEDEVLKALNSRHE